MPALILLYCLYQWRRIPYHASGGSADHPEVGLQTVLDSVGVWVFTTDAGRRSTRQIVEAHGGRVELESSPGRGTRVSLALPVVLG